MFKCPSNLFFSLLASSSTLSFLFPVWCARSASSRSSTCRTIPSSSTCLRASRHRSTCVSSWSTRQEATWWCTSTRTSSQSHGPCTWRLYEWKEKTLNVFFLKYARTHILGFPHRWTLIGGEMSSVKLQGLKCGKIWWRTWFVLIIIT